MPTKCEEDDNNDYRPDLFLSILKIRYGIIKRV